MTDTQRAGASSASAADGTSTGRLPNRWIQLTLGFVAMMAISSPQYTWALFTGPLQQRVGTDLATLQVTFSVLIILQTWLAPAQGWLVDRFGPRLLLSLGAVLVGLSWVLAASATSVVVLYLTYGVLGGIGTGIIYIGVIGLMVRWFPDRRGFVAGLAAAGYGVGAILTTFPINSMLKSSGYHQTLLVFGIIQGLIALVAAQGLRRPPAAVHGQQTSTEAAKSFSRTQSVRSYSPRQMLRTKPFYIMFVMMACMSASGLMVTSQVGAFAKDFGVGNALVLGAAALPLSLTLSRATNGFSRPLFGWISDHIGREPTMLLAFGIEAIGVLVLLVFQSSPIAFVLLTGVVFLGWGEIFSLFPSTLTDMYGPAYATVNYGFLYIAQGIGALLGAPLAALIRETTGSWTPVFVGVAVLDAGVAIAALTVLRPAHVRWISEETAELGAQRTALSEG
jgi:OFA family oxalate/formate antiporter-like MFS transporter